MERQGTDTIGARVAKARRLRGLSQRGLAKAAKLAASHVFTIEANQSPKANHTTNTISSLAGALGVSMEWLITGEGEAPTDERVAS